MLGILILRAWLWQLTGKEAIEASDHSITIRRVILGFGRRYEYLAEHIKDLRASPVQSSRAWPAVANSWGLSGGALAFDYGAKAFYFALGADEAEAKQIVAAIKARFPALARAASEDVPFGVGSVSQRLITYDVLAVLQHTMCNVMYMGVLTWCI